MKKFFALGFGAAILLVVIALFLVSKFIKNEQEKLIAMKLHDEGNSHLSLEIIPFDDLSYNFLATADHKKLDDAKNIYFLNFWATWCAPCVQELPELKTLTENHPNIEFGFCTDEDMDKAEKFLRKKNLSTLPTFQYTAESLPTYFDHTSIPSTYIIDNKAKIMYRIKGITNWNSKTIINLLASIEK